MSKANLVRVGWARIKHQIPAVIAAALMYGGLNQMISTLRYPLTGAVLGLINFIIRTGFRNVFLLQNPYSGVPWTFHVRVAAVGVMVMTVGLLVGVWVNAKAGGISADMHSG